MNKLIKEPKNFVFLGLPIAFFSGALSLLGLGTVPSWITGLGALLVVIGGIFLVVNMFMGKK